MKVGRRSRRRYVCLLCAIAHLLVLKAGDARQKTEIRSSAQAALDAMTPDDCFTAGVAGDYGEVCLEFLRIFDVSDMDPARLLPDISDFKRALCVLFVEGYVLCEDEEPCVDAAAKKTTTLAKIALETVENPLVLKCSGISNLRRKISNAMREMTNWHARNDKCHSAA